MHSRLSLLVLIAPLFMLGCAEQKALSAAQANGSPEAYEAFLEQFPHLLCVR